MKKFILLVCGLLFLALSSTVSAQLSVQLKLEVIGDDVFIYWAAENQADVELYNLQRSTNGRLFEQVVDQNGNGANDATYTHTDADLANGYYAYRMEVIYRDGSSELLGYEIVNVNVQPVFGNSPFFPSSITDDRINE
jgi:hypothetical protein